MRKPLFSVLAFAVSFFAGMAVTGCREGKNVSDAMQTDTLPPDTASVDSLSYAEEETPMPKAADELFDDFIFNFASNGRLQLSRIKFPLVVTNGEETDEIKKSQWEMENFFMEQDYYTLIFDNIQQKEIVKDTCVSHAVIEKIYLESGYVTQYIFDRRNGKWMMTSINETDYKGTSNESFLDFYTRFAADSLFRMSSIKNPLKFSGPDPDDDFSVVEGVILPEQWQAFAPDLPHEMIYNIVYGEPERGSSEKIFVIRGIANGLETELTFRKKDGKWKLTHLTI